MIVDCVYMIPQWYECPKCKSQFKWSRDEDFVGLNEPYCPVCFLDFIHKNVPMAIRKIEK